MTAFDTDVFTLILEGYKDYLDRLDAIPAGEQTVPVVVWEEVLRGRFNVVRQAEAKKTAVPLTAAYDLLREALMDTRRFTILAYTPAAHALFLAWRAAKIRVGSRDLRIAATCVAHGVELVTRNRRDFDQVPGLNLTVWN